MLYQVITTVQNALKKYISVVHVVISPLVSDYNFILQTVDISMCSSLVANYLELLLTGFITPAN